MKKKILLVEDLVDWIYRIEKILADKYEVHSVTNSTDAQKLVMEQHFDLVLLDIMLDGSPLQGDEVLKEIVKVSPDTKVIMISALTKISIIEECFENGARWYITKETPKKDILARISSVLSGYTYTHQLYCNSQLDYAVNSITRVIEEGKKAAMYISQIIGNSRRVPILTNESLMNVFYTPLEYLDPSHIELIDWNLPEQKKAERYVYTGEKDEVLIYGADNEVYSIQESLNKKNIKSHIAYKTPEISKIVFEEKIACVVLMMDLKEALYRLRIIKSIDPRINVIIYYSGLANIADAIMLKANGAYKLIDDNTNLIDSIQTVLSKAKDQFSDSLLYEVLIHQKVSWCMGFITGLLHFCNLKAIADNIPLSLEEKETLNYVYHTLLCEHFARV